MRTGQSFVRQVPHDLVGRLPQKVGIAEGIKRHGALGRSADHALEGSRPMPEALARVRCRSAVLHAAQDGFHQREGLRIAGKEAPRGLEPLPSLGILDRTAGRREGVGHFVRACRVDQQMQQGDIRRQGARCAGRERRAELLGRRRLTPPHGRGSTV